MLRKHARTLLVFCINIVYQHSTNADVAAVAFPPPLFHPHIDGFDGDACGVGMAAFFYGTPHAPPKIVYLCDGRTTWPRASPGENRFAWRNVCVCVHMQMLCVLLGDDAKGFQMKPATGQPHAINTLDRSRGRWSRMQVHFCSAKQKPNGTQNPREYKWLKLLSTSARSAHTQTHALTHTYHRAIY